MIIGFFGKGGSGKTTTSTDFLRVIGSEYSNVLAIDADHNMDLSFNLGVEDPSLFIERPRMTPSGISLMTSGPHTEEVFRGDVCSHYLFRPLKEYLKTAQLPADHLVVVDNTAGMDSVGAGIPACLTVGVICAEPALHSLKVGRQIIEGLRRTNIPFVIVANKIQSEEQEQEVRKTFSDYSVVRIPWHAPAPSASSLPDEVIAAFRELHQTIRAQLTAQPLIQTGSTSLL